jgi:SAM-dependent methyltransferase
VADAIFAHPRLAPLYDAFDGPRDDLPAYVSIADELGAHRVLDVGCGTGSLAIMLAGAGRTVIGADPAAASLDVAKSKDTSNAVTWVHTDAAGVAAVAADLAAGVPAAGADLAAGVPAAGADLAAGVPAAGADLAVMTGNVAQVFLTDEDWAQALQAIGAALRPRGYLVFETRRPARRAWQEWAADAGTTTRDIPGSGQVERRGEVTAVKLPFVSFRYTYTFRADGAVITSDSTLRFRGREELESSLAAQAYQVLEVREAPDRPGYEFIFITQRTV